MSGHATPKLRLLAVFLIFFVSAGALLAQPLVCAICGKPIYGNYYVNEDQIEHVQKNVCSNCNAVEARCYYCQLP
ncbi:MAG TPA: hypothetical protein VG754_04250, partial [Verrucomicrobiae bacterium]|nr:hypothetical protein [Verrucomicrobiae bacterium]